MVALLKFFRILLRIENRLTALCNIMQLILDHHHGVSSLEVAWLDNQDVMFKLKISESTLRRRRLEGTIPCTRIKGKYYYKESDIRAVLRGGLG